MKCKSALENVSDAEASLMGDYLTIKTTTSRRAYRNLGGINREGSKTQRTRKGMQQNKHPASNPYASSLNTAFILFNASLKSFSEAA